MNILLACPHFPETSGLFTFIFLFASLGNRRARHQAFKLGLCCSILLLQCDKVIMASSVQLSPFWPLGSILVLIWRCSNELPLFPLWAETEWPRRRDTVGPVQEEVARTFAIRVLSRCLALCCCQQLCGSGQARLQENSKKKPHFFPFWVTE